MDATVIDTLRFANRLKAAGVQDRQAEAISSALNDELAGGVATKDDLAHAVVELKTEIAKVDAKVDAKFDNMNEKIEALNGKFESQSRHMFLVLALIAALGLYNAAAPHFSNEDPSVVSQKRVYSGCASANAFLARWMLARICSPDLRQT